MEAARAVWRRRRWRGPEWRAGRERRRTAQVRQAGKRAAESRFGIWSAAEQTVWSEAGIWQHRGEGQGSGKHRRIGLVRQAAEQSAESRFGFWRATERPFGAKPGLAALAKAAAREWRSSGAAELRQGMETARTNFGAKPGERPAGRFENAPRKPFRAQGAFVRPEGSFKRSDGPKKPFDGGRGAGPGGARASAGAQEARSVGFRGRVAQGMKKEARRRTVENGPLQHLEANAAKDSAVAKEPGAGRRKNEASIRRAARWFQEAGQAGWVLKAGRIRSRPGGFSKPGRPGGGNRGGSRFGGKRPGGR